MGKSLVKSYLSECNASFNDINYELKILSVHEGKEGNGMEKRTVIDLKSIWKSNEEVEVARLEFLPKNNLTTPKADETRQKRTYETCCDKWI
jgi:hypothetical protein